MTDSDETKTLKVASGYHGSLHKIDPATITTMAEYEIVENLYGNLLEYDAAGAIVADIPNSFEWIGRNLIFTFGERARTRAGHLIGAEDAAMSLKRSILRKGSGHGDIRKLLCPGFHLNSIDDECPGVRTHEGRLVLTAHDDNAKQNLAATLASADHGILPRTSLSKNSNDPKIVDYTETSGAYHAASNADHTLPLRVLANNGYHRFSSDTVKQVLFIHTSSAEAGLKLLDGELDYLPASIYLFGPASRKILSSPDQFHFIESPPTRLYMLCFSPSALERFTVKQRVHAGRLVEEWAKVNRCPPRSAETKTFFDAQSDGHLDENQNAVIQELRNENNAPAFTDPIELAVIGPDFESLRLFMKNHPEINVTTGGTPAYLRPADEKPDMYIVFTDSSRTESPLLLAHNFQVGVFHLPGLDKQVFLDEFTNTSDRTSRLTKLNQLHFDLLRHVAIFPIFVNSYFTVSRNAWRLPKTPGGIGPRLSTLRTRKRLG